MPFETNQHAAQWLTDNLPPNDNIYQYPETLNKVIFEYLNDLPQPRYQNSLPDNIAQFHNILINALMKKGYFINLGVLGRILLTIHQWENQNSARVHKGTLYYYWGGLLLKGGNIDHSFLLLHKALDEDMETVGGNTTPDTPAYKTVTLQDSEAQTWAPYVREMRAYLKHEFYSHYPNNNNVNFETFTQNFLCLNNVNEAFNFVFTLARLYANSELDDYTESNFSSQYRLNLLFDLAVVIESYLKRKGSFNDKDLNQMVNSLVAKHYPINIANVIGNLNRSAENDPNDFNNTISGLLNGQILLQNVPYPQLIRDATITYCVRNFGGHKTVGPSILNSHYNEIRQAVFNTLFWAVETYS